MANGLLKRIGDWLAINPNDLLLEPDNPHAEAAHLIAEMESGLRQAQDAIAAAVVQERRLERQWQQALARANEWDTKTDAALQAGDDKQARRALKRKQFYQAKAAELQAALGKQRQTIAEMKAGLGALRAQVEQIKSRSGTA
jgi:phage shock protein A